MTTEAFSGLVAALDPPLIVVTTAVGDERAGCLVGFHAQSSITPERYCVWLSKANHTYRVALRSDYLALHFLDTGDLSLATHFGTMSGDTVDKFADLPTETGTGGVPLLTDCPNVLVVRRSALLDEGGDHVCLPAEVVAARHGKPFTPFRLSQAAHLEPGHGNEERHGPPTERAAS
ncbi:flavin reductase family protein [Cryptosporangium aurantiacum]|uniref:NADH-FMN oxidoreductase RutF, flavin reductase (DIM6/NTAB) family n=1 Tax=Cryptosporangium aurantiacum TaxID=134849 RepID=A0A1M7PBN0_9ACTN|nr:flavin reductase family protein [Cryptosporangium aurantiacum]SHN14324.1 NADH-FMN oxidoreductase RutF, flavin reductase (DIM6/NTAB) family [Cryptosporangium aurantiacum]